MKTIAACLLAVLTAVPVAAQSTADPAAFSEPYETSFRGFFVVTEQSFAAKTTVEAAFGNSTQPFFGGGVQVASPNGVVHRVRRSPGSRRPVSGRSSTTARRIRWGFP